jgi:putative metallohydrolase (TIGR04338 family)
VRDSQRQRVYEAEFALRQLYDNAEAIDSRTVVLDGIRLTLPPEGKFGCVESMQRYVDRVMPGVCVRARQGDRFAHAEPWHRVIAIPADRDRWACREIVVLHELAHIATRSDHAHGAHGPEFVSAFTDLLGTTMGAEVALAYRILCAHARVRMSCTT